jgi:phosphatidate cytidylyltransferase
VVTAAVLIAALLAALFLLPRAWLAVLVGAMVAGAGREWARLCGLGADGSWIYALALTFTFAALYNAEPWQPALALAAAFWIAVAPFWLWRGAAPAQGRRLLVAGFFVVAPAGLGLLALAPAGALLVLGLVWIADSAAYFVGSAWGRRTLAPAISPGKTWEGALGGTAAALVYAIICATFIEGLLVLPYLAAALLLAVLSIVGDLFESAVKRQAGVKDSGSLLPGHGGILDRIDSATATLPVAALLVPWILGR